MTREQLIKALREADPEDLMNGTVLDEAADMLEADGVPVGYTDAYWLASKSGGHFSKGKQCGEIALYSAPQPAIQERKPLTDEQIAQRSNPPSK